MLLSKPSAWTCSVGLYKHRCQNLFPNYWTKLMPKNMTVSTRDELAFLVDRRISTATDDPICPKWSNGEPSISKALRFSQKELFESGLKSINVTNHTAFEKSISIHQKKQSCCFNMLPKNSCCLFHCLHCSIHPKCHPSRVAVKQIT